MPRRCLAVLGLCLLAGSLAAQPATAPPLAERAAASPRPVQPPGRPRIGLVLSGGGARGLAHVGVLKVLERERVPIDVIAGTSMGAIIGGLYASGMSAQALERELLKVDWNALFASRVAREELSQRRKEDDFEVAPALELGLRDGALRIPLGTLSSRGLESLLRRYTLPVRGIRSFDALPTPFRAVATDMENGRARVLSEGDLALALRSSMSVPGVFAPTEVDGRILGDGGLVDNLPVDVARAMGADVVIVVNIGTPIAGRETLGSLVGVTAQMIAILTEQNVQRSLASLTKRDLLIAPQLGTLSSADFDKMRDFVQLGELQAQAQVVQLADYAVDADGYRAWAQARAQAQDAPPTLAFVRFEGSERSNAQRSARELASQPGRPFEVARAEADVRRLAASGDYERVDYQLVRDESGRDGLVFKLDEKSWGPNYLKLGLDLATDFSGRASFNVKVVHTSHWLDAAGTEWRNRVRIGSDPAWYTELYRPLGWTLGPSNDWFVAATAAIERREVVTYVGPEGPESGRLRRTSGVVAFDLGQPWGGFGELRAGVFRARFQDKLLIVRDDDAGPVASNLDLTGVRLRAVVDQLDYAFLPQRGYRLVGELASGRALSRAGGVGVEQDFTRFDVDAIGALSFGRLHTINLALRSQLAGQASVLAQGLYSLGGFQRLSGYKPGQVEGNYLLFGRASYYYRLTPPALTRGFFAGFSLEAGNAWRERGDVSLGDLRSGMSAFIGADTGLGPLYLGLVHAPRGDTGLYLFLGRP